MGTSRQFALLSLVAILATALLLGCQRTAAALPTLDPPLSATPDPTPETPSATATHEAAQTPSVGHTPPSPTAVPTATPSPTSTPQPQVLAVDAELAAHQGAALRDLAARQGLTLQPYRGVPPAGADWTLQWGPKGAGEATFLRGEPYAVVVHPLSELDGCSLQELQSGWPGSALALRLVTADEGAVERELLGGLAMAGDMVRVGDEKAAKEYVASHEDAWALLPWEIVDYHVKALAVDGQPLDPRAFQGYPLVRRLWLKGGRPVPLELATALERALRYVPPPTVELVAVGDMMLGRTIGELMEVYGAAYPFAGPGVRGALAGADIAFGNLECPISARGVPQPKEYQFRAPPLAIGGLIYAGLDVVSLANNHTGDYGPLALSDTLHALGQAGIVAVGAGEEITAAHEAKVIVANGLRVAFLAYDGASPPSFVATATRPGNAPIDGQRMAADVRAARRRADVVIVSCHWGVEYTPYANAEQQHLAQLLEEAGASLVLGHHPHVLQGLRYSRSALTAYSLGNFIFDMGPPRERWEGVILRCLLDPSGVKTVALVPVFINGGQPEVLAPQAGAYILQRVARVTREQGGAAQ